MAEEKKTTTKKTTTTKTTAPKKEVVKKETKTATVKKETVKAETAKVEKVETVKKTTTKKVAEPKKEVKKIRVTLIKSPIGYNKKQARICKTLGLGKLNSSHEIVDNECVRGMISKVTHLVRVEELN